MNRKYIPVGNGCFDDYYEVYFKEFRHSEVVEKADVMFLLKELEKWYVAANFHSDNGRPDLGFAMAYSSMRTLSVLLEKEDWQPFLSSFGDRIRKIVAGVVGALGKSVFVWNDEPHRKMAMELVLNLKPLFVAKSLLPVPYQGLIPPQPFVGTPMEITYRKSAAELRALERERERIVKQEILTAKQALAEQKERKSVIPFNQEFEDIFAKVPIDSEGDSISSAISPIFKRLARNLQDSSLQFDSLRKGLQLIKSLCKHYIEDEHYCYYDDFYSPDYDVDSFLEAIYTAKSFDQLTAEALTLLQVGASEIMTMEAYYNYCLADGIERFVLCS